MSHKILRWLTSLILGLAVLGSGLDTQPARAAGPWYVAPSGNDSNTCLSPGTACATISGAIGKAADGDTINVAIGTYTSTATNGVGVVWINQNITLTLLGGWDENFTTQNGMSTIDGQGTRGGIDSISDGNLRVDHFAIQNGNNGGIVIESSGGSPATLILSNSTVSNNFNDYGGGIEITYGTVTLNNSTVNNNMASISGGGISIYGGTVTLNNSTISENTAQAQGGGIYYNYLNTSLDINNSSIVNNHSSQGGGFYRYLNSGIVTFRNSILANNTAPTDSDCTGTIDTSDHNIIGNSSGCTITVSSGDLTNVNPQLGPLQDNGGPTFTHALLIGGPAIDAGNPAGCTDQNGNLLTTDQRGVARPQGTRCDIGAFELEADGDGAEEVTIDIKPGRFPNRIKLTRNVCRDDDNVYVAILTTPTFNARTVDVSTLQLGDPNLSGTATPYRSRVTDVDRDGDRDLVLTFSLCSIVTNGALNASSTKLVLTGRTLDGNNFTGTDSVKVVR